MRVAVGTVRTSSSLHHSPSHQQPCPATTGSRPTLGALPVPLPMQHSCRCCRLHQQQRLLGPLTPFASAALSRHLRAPEAPTRLRWRHAAQQTPSLKLTCKCTGSLRRQLIRARPRRPEWLPSWSSWGHTREVARLQGKETLTPFECGLLSATACLASATSAEMASLMLTQLSMGSL